MTSPSRSSSMRSMYSAAIMQTCSDHLFHIQARSLDLLRDLLILHCLLTPCGWWRWKSHQVPLFLESANHVAYANRLRGIRLYCCHPSRECVLPILLFFQGSSARADTETFYNISNRPRVFLSYCVLSIVLYALVAFGKMHIKVHSVNAYVDRSPTMRTRGSFFIYMSRDSFSNALSVAVLVHYEAFFTS